MFWAQTGAAVGGASRSHRSQTLSDVLQSRVGSPLHSNPGCLYFCGQRRSKIWCALEKHPHAVAAPLQQQQRTGSRKHLKFIMKLVSFRPKHKQRLTSPPLVEIKDVCRSFEASVWIDRNPPSNPALQHSMKRGRTLHHLSNMKTQKLLPFLGFTHN